MGAGAAPSRDDPNGFIRDVSGASLPPGKTSSSVPFVHATLAVRPRRRGTWARPGTAATISTPSPRHAARGKMLDGWMDGLDGKMGWLAPASVSQPPVPNAPCPSWDLPLATSGFAGGASLILRVSPPSQRVARCLELPWARRSTTTGQWPMT